MSLINSLLQTCEAEQYAPVFKQHLIDLTTFKILNDSDLIELGIDKERRELILKCIQNLEIKVEGIPNVDIDEQYIKLILDQMYIQLIKHLAILSIATKQQEVALCNFHLSPATRTLLNSLASFDKRLKTFENQFIPRKKKRPLNLKEKILIPIMLITLTTSIVQIYKAFKQ